MISTDAFSYINVLDKAADASWTRENLIANNIANADTPGYKRQDIDFQSVLRNELSNYKYMNLDQKMNAVDLSKLNPTVYTDHGNFSYRLDRNNVDIDTEQVELASEQIKYQALTSSITSEFQRLQTVIK
ncbi:MAG: flagellar basal body rod protein FlgB [Agathobacter sp.]|nr:flagellar basal body rod protein FlgB [Agathobacter sp.]MBQ3559996.1 flagellar basal body rod protein FlgB [Agathobacter sp.]